MTLTKIINIWESMITAPRVFAHSSNWVKSLALVVWLLFFMLLIVSTF